MKKLLFAVFFLSAHIAFANKIDSLKTDKEIAVFIQHLFQQKQPDSYPEKWYIFSLSRPDSVWGFFKRDTIYDQWATQKWQKVDFNKDKKTDLFAIIYIRNINEPDGIAHICAIVDKGNDIFSLHEIPGYFKFESYAAMPAMIGNEQSVLFHYRTMKDSLVREDSLSGKEPSAATYPVTPDPVVYYELVKTDTLIYKFGGFIEKSKNKLSAKPIKSIFFQQFPGFGFGASFQLTIFNDGPASLIRDQTLDEKAGSFRVNINKVQLNEIFNLINYLNIETLDDYYSVNATDLQRASVKVFFLDGSSKEIEDYGLQATLGLVRLYEMFRELNANEKWK